MKKKSAAWIIAALILAGYSLIFTLGCRKGTVATHTRTFTYTLSTPVYKLKQSVLDNINGNPTQSIDSFGKIYIRDKFIFLNDVDKGVHIIDNSNPAHPVQTAFLNIPGNQDIAIKGNILYADMYSDLLSIDISDLHHARINSMVPALFTNRENINGFNLDSNQVIVSWIKKDTTVTVPDYPSGIYYLGRPAFYANAAASSGGGNKTGVAGSTAKMVLINDYLYAITERHTLGTLDLADPKTPKLVSNTWGGLDLETIFPFKDKLFLGSDIGTFIFDISDPANPTKVGEFSHGQACDPVITDGNYAYVTLHAGTSCGGESNELDVVNVQNLSQPSLLKTYPMTSPKGLSMDGSLLFVCDGPEKVKIYDATHPENLLLLSTISNTGPYDVIAANNNLMVVTTKGLYQYDYSNVNNISLLSFYSVK